MNFPSFADTEAFLAIGSKCSQALTGDASIFTGCYDAIRPIGIALFYAIPFLASDDPITISYIILAMHIMMFLVVCLCITSLYDPDASHLLSRVSPAWFLIFSTVVLVFCLPVIPVVLSDLPSVAFFMLGVSILFQKRLTGVTAFGAGLCFALACLLRQYYFAFTAVAVLSYIIFMSKELKIIGLRPVVWFFIGCVPALLQFAWIWLHTGKFWVYDSSVASLSLYVNKAPYVEMIIYSIPTYSAYVTSIGSEILDPFTFFCLKLLKGFYSLYPAVYLGNAPFQQEPPVIIVNGTLILKAYVGFFVLLFATAFGIWKSPYKYKAMLFLAFFMSVIFAAIGHVESRYFLMPKILYLCYAFVFAFISFKMLFCRKINTTAVE